MRGKLSIRMAEASAEFDLQNAADRLFAIELAATWRAVNDAAAEKERRHVQILLTLHKVERVQAKQSLESGDKDFLISRVQRQGSHVDSLVPIKEDASV